METFDYVIRSKEFGSYYGYSHDFEFGGWFLGSLIEAVGYDSIADAERELADSNGPAARKDCMICKRTMSVEVVCV